MNKLTLEDFKVTFHEAYEEYETYVVRVEVSNKALIFVSCQYEEDYSHKLTNHLSCINDSGSDYVGSGLSVFVESLDNCAEIEDELQQKINACANAEITVESVEEYLSRTLDLELIRAYPEAFSAFYINHKALEKYTAETGEVVVAAVDYREYRADRAIIHIRAFKNETRYKKWFDEATKDHQSHWAQDIGLVRMLREAL